MSEETTTIDQINPEKAVAIFNGGLDDMLTKIAEDLKNFTPDISTDKGRKEIKSRAYKASLCKGKLDDMAEELSEEAKKRVKAINADRDRAREFLDNLRDEIRKPVDDWEDAEKARVAAHEAAIQVIAAYEMLPIGCPSQYIRDSIGEMGLFFAGRDWEEFALRAANLNAEVLQKLEHALAERVKYESEQAELAILRAEKLKRDAEEAEHQRIAHEEQIAAAAAEKARKEVEEDAARKVKEAADKAAAEIAAAARAEASAREEAEIAKQREVQTKIDAMQAASKAESDRLIAAQQAEDDRIAAVDAERKRVSDLKAAEDAATAKREANIKHKSKINNEVLSALAALDCVLNDVQAKKIVIAIAEGRIPHVSISY